MSEERVFNLFLYFEDGIASEYGVRHHRRPGSDDDKAGFLRARVDEDSRAARRFPLKRTFTPEEWRAALRLGDELAYFNEGFEAFRAKRQPIYCLTPIVDGVPTVDLTTGVGPFRGDIVSAQEGAGAVPDYLVHYVDGRTFRFADLINDDYFNAIRTLFNAKLYVSCSKLLVSCIDTLAFVEYGDAPGNFSKWLDRYVDLTPHGITSQELWEYRNSVIHMTNLASKKVLAGKVSPISFYVGGPPSRSARGPGEPKPFNLYGLIQSCAAGIGRWGDTYNADPDKILKFIERYDTTISDSRVATVVLESPDMAG